MTENSRRSFSFYPGPSRHGYYIPPLSSTAGSTPDRVPPRPDLAFPAISAPTHDVGAVPAIRFPRPCHITSDLGHFHKAYRRRNSVPRPTKPLGKPSQPLFAPSSLQVATAAPASELPDLPSGTSLGGLAGGFPAVIGRKRPLSSHPRVSSSGNCRGKERKSALFFLFVFLLLAREQNWISHRDTLSVLTVRVAVSRR